MEENSEEKKTSKISNMIDQSTSNSMGSQYIVHYSENNWETNEEINIILNDNATINQLIEEAVKKFKNELFYDNINKKNLIVRIFKKKKKIPNFEYPICNLNSKVKDFAKSHFCLVENKKEGEENKKEKEKDNIEENININKESENGNMQDNNKKNIKSIEKTNNTPISSNSNIGQTGKESIKNDKPSCKPCIII